MSLVRFRPKAPLADVAHLVERHLAKVEVASSSLVIRSKTKSTHAGAFLFWKEIRKRLEQDGSRSEFKQSGGLFESPRACRGRQPSGEPRHRGYIAIKQNGCKINFKQLGGLFESPRACRGREPSGEPRHRGYITV